MTCQVDHPWRVALLPDLAKVGVLMLPGAKRCAPTRGVRLAIGWLCLAHGSEPGQAGIKLTGDESGACGRHVNLVATGVCVLLFQRYAWLMLAVASQSIPQATGNNT